MSLPTSVRYLLSVLLLAGALAGAAADDTQTDLHRATDANGMPLALFYPPIPNPVWLHSSVAVVHGALRTELMHPAVTRSLTELLAQPAVDGCIPVGRLPEQRVLSYPRSENLDDNLRQAPFVLHAQVTGMATGVQASTPGALLRLSPLRIARGASAGKGPFYVFMPVGRVQLGSKVICKTDPEYSTLPELGDEVLILSALPGGEHRNQVTLETPGDLVTIHQGKLLFPQMYARTLDADPGLHNTLVDLLDRAGSPGSRQ